MDKCGWGNIVYGPVSGNTSVSHCASMCQGRTVIGNVKACIELQTASERETQVQLPATLSNRAIVLLHVM